MTKPKLRKNADINPPQSPHDGIHTCSSGCKKPGCTRTLRDTIEEQDKQIEALKRDVLEKTAELRKSEEHNAALCERMQDLSGELHTASCANANAHKENARLRSVAEDNKRECEATRIEALKRDVLEKTAELRNLKEVVAELRISAEDDLDSIETARIENARLKAEVERLTEAGNHLWAFAHNCVILQVYPKTAQEKINIWHAAKEGNHP
jgi:uncharacterized coiled-coil protein SlyX